MLRREIDEVKNLTGSIKTCLHLSKQIKELSNSLDEEVKKLNGLGFLS